MNVIIIPFDWITDYIIITAEWVYSILLTDITRNITHYFIIPIDQLQSILLFPLCTLSPHTSTSILRKTFDPLASRNFFLVIFIPNFKIYTMSQDISDEIIDTFEF